MSVRTRWKVFYKQRALLLGVSPEDASKGAKAGIAWMLRDLEEHASWGDAEQLRGMVVHTLLQESMVPLENQSWGEPQSEAEREAELREEELDFLYRIGAEVHVAADSMLEVHYTSN